MTRGVRSARQGVSFAKGLSDCALDALAKAGGIEVVDRGAPITVEGGPADRVFAILEGGARITHRGHDGRARTAAFLVANDVIGVHHGGGYPFGAEAGVDSRVRAFDAEAFARRCPNCPNIHVAVLSRAANDVAAMQDWLWLPMRRKDIADVLGMRRETLSRVLCDLRLDGVCRPTG